MKKFFTDVFTRDKKQCVFCGKDLMHSFDDFWSAKADHLIPREMREDLAQSTDNMVTSCHVCNNLKGEFFPDELTQLNPSIPEHKEQILSRLRAHIFEKRAEKLNLFVKWFE